MVAVAGRRRHRAGRSSRASRDDLESNGVLLFCDPDRHSGVRGKGLEGSTAGEVDGGLDVGRVAADPGRFDRRSDLRGRGNATERVGETPRIEH